MAAKYIAGVCAVQKFEYTRFEGMVEDKFHGYITWNAARRAWEQGWFEWKVQPKEWMRKGVDRKVERMTGK